MSRTKAKPEKSDEYGTKFGPTFDEVMSLPNVPRRSRDEVPMAHQQGDWRTESDVIFKMNRYDDPTPEWFNRMAREAWEEAKRIRQTNVDARALSKYVNDPVSFGIERLGESYTRSVRQVMESVRDNPVTVARSGNGVGKSHAAARIAFWWFSVYQDSKVYMTAAPPLENLKRILWGEVMSIRENHPELFGKTRLRAMSIVRDAKSFITGVAIPTSGTTEQREAKFSGKHSPHLLFIVDEGDAVPDEVYKGIESCMSGGMARLLIMFNPRFPSGPVYIKERDHQANVVELSALDHPNVVQGLDIYPGAVTRETTVRRFNEWTRPLQAGETCDAECVEVPPFLIGQSATSMDGKQYAPLPSVRRKITDPAFSYMVLGRYPPQGENQLINQAWVDAARSRWDAYMAVNGEIPPLGVQPVMGLDIAELGTDYNVCCLRYGGFVARFKTWAGVDPDDSTSRAMIIYKEYNVNIAFIDGTGVGSSVAPAMARRGRESDVRAVSVKFAEKPMPFIKTEIGEFAMLRDQLWWAVREWLRVDPGAMLPPEPMLLEELRAQAYRINEHTGRIEVLGKDEIRSKLHRSSDRADALCLTFMPINRPVFLRATE